MKRGPAGFAPSGVVAIATVAAVFMIAQQVASKAVRDGFFLSEFPVTALPVATLAAAVVSLGAALLFGRFIAAFSPAAAVPVLFAANGLLFFVEAAVVDHVPEVVAAGLYLHTAAFGGAVISGFWSVVNERFDPYTARRVVSQITAGTTFGGIAGGALTWALSDIGTAALLAGFGASSVVCAVAIGAVARGGVDETESAAGDDANAGGRDAPARISGLSALARSSYLRRVGAVVVFGALMSGVIDYVFKAGVATDRSEQGLVELFAVFYTAVGIATFVVQAFGARKLLKRLGVVPTASAFPITALSLLSLALLWPGVMTLVLLRGGLMVVENSLYRAGYELFYTPVPKQQKRSAKMLIDLGCDRLGTAAASGIALLAITLGAATANKMLLIVGAACAVVIAILMTVIRRQYIASLAEQLRTSLEREAVAANAGGAQALATTFVADLGLWPAASDPAVADASTGDAPIDRDQLMEAVRARAEEKKRSPDPSRSAPPPRARSTVSESLLATPLRERLRLTAPGEDGWAELGRTAPGVIGQLGDIVLSRRESLEVRLRAAELLASVPSKRAAEALLGTLAAPELRLRRAGALALWTLCQQAPGLRPERRLIVDLAGRELRRPARLVPTESGFERSSPFLKDARGNDLSSTLEIVFILLAVLGGTDDLRLALTAITSGDARQRGTGLEYLDNLLTGDLRQRLVALAANPESTRAELRVDRAAVQELAEQLRSGAIDVRELRRRYAAARRQQYEGAD